MHAGGGGYEARLCIQGPESHQRPPSGAQIAKRRQKTWTAAQVSPEHTSRKADIAWIEIPTGPFVSQGPEPEAVGLGGYATHAAVDVERLATASPRRPFVRRWPFSIN
jgi:hypothetical protein